MNLQNRRRIFYEQIRTHGAFPDGRIKLDVLFKCEDSKGFLWTPPWKAVAELSASAKYIEGTNEPTSKWIPKLEHYYKEIKLAKDLELAKIMEEEKREAEAEAKAKTAKEATEIRNLLQQLDESNQRIKAIFDDPFLKRQKCEAC
jgi:hypothetical protein